MSMATADRRVATYERVSSEDQRERETIKTQTDELARSLAADPAVRLVERFADDGVSGTIPLAERPAGSRLMRAAADGRFDELWTYKFDRLGRDAIDLLVVRRRFDELGVRVRSVVEGEPDLLGYGVQAVVADNARREFLRRSIDGVNRAAREGRYCGGIVAFGYALVGEKGKARYEPDRALLWHDLSAADIVRRIYHWVSVEHWSCPRVARELNLLAVPTSYVKDGRMVDRTGQRKQRTQGHWTAGGVCRLVKNRTYRGELVFGKRTARERQAVTGAVPSLVSVELWEAAQTALAGNRRLPKNSVRVNALRGVVKCAIDGLTFISTHGRDGIAYLKCNGHTVDRGPLFGRCPSRHVRADALEDVIWTDIERWLRDPDDELLRDLDEERRMDGTAAVAEAEALTLPRALEEAEQRRKRVIKTFVDGHINETERDELLLEVETDRAELQRRLDALEAVTQAKPALAPALLDDIRARLDAGLTPEQRQEIVAHLVSVVIETIPQELGKPKSLARIAYRFPRVGVVSSRSGIRAGLDYTVVRRVVELPGRRRPKEVAA